MEQTQRWRSSS